MKDKRYCFENWMHSQELKRISINEFVNLMEESFIKFRGINIWNIDDARQFSSIYENLLSDKYFKRRNKKAFKVLTAYGDLYYRFLSSNKKETPFKPIEKETSIESIEKEQPIDKPVVKEISIDESIEKEIFHESNSVSTTGTKTIQFDNEHNQCVEFFSDKKAGEFFYLIFDYSKTKTPSCFLDVRTTIIGVKENNERLRYYADKNGILRFSKIECEPIDLNILSMDSFADCLYYADQVDLYFAQHKEEVSLIKEIGYVYHTTYGFGKIKSKDESVISILFDGLNETKRFQIGHKSITEISQYQYENKIIPNNVEPKPVIPKRIIWDKYETALLVEAFWKIENEPALRTQIIKKLSEDLRRKAINQGLTIDETFRNVNGISIQLSNLATSFFPNRSAMHKTSIFEEIATLYKDNRKAFDALLKEAHILVPNTADAKPFKTVDWHSLSDMSYTSPVYVIYKSNQQIFKQDFTSWTDCYKYLLTEMYKDVPFAFYSMANDSNISFLSNIPQNLRRPLEIGKDIYAEGNMSATNLILTIKKILDFCNIEYKKVKIEYEYKSKGNVTPKDSDEKFHRKNNEQKQPRVFAIDETLKEQIIPLLKDRYTYGLRYDSPRELNRLRAFAAEKDIILPENDDELKKILFACGNIIEGKLYAKDESIQKELALLVQEIVDEGVSVIYYESLLERQSEFMSSNHIFGEEMLKDLLKKSLTDFAFGGKYMNVGDRSTEIELVGNEIRRIWEENAICHYADMVTRLPYIPENIIQRALSFNPIFVWNAEGEYLLIDRFSISEREKADIIEFVAAECEKDGFASLLEIPIKNLEVENYQVSYVGMQTAIYESVLKNDYSLNGKILTKKGAQSLDAVTIVKATLREKDEVTFDEALAVVKDVIGDAQRHIAFRALYDEFVRVDKNRFVARKHLRFEIDKIDEVLKGMLPDGFGALKSITTYAMFPMCGYMWNAYVLESYCYLFSRQFSLHIVNFNDKNAGIIAKKNLNKNYCELLALATAKSNVTLDESHTLDYLCENGYLAKHSYGRIKEVLQKAEDYRGAK